MVSGGGLIASDAVVLTSDGGFFATSAGRLLCIYSSRTGQRVSLLGAHLEPITGIALHPSHGNQVRNAIRAHSADFRASTAADNSIGVYSGVHSFIGRYCEALGGSGRHAAKNRRHRPAAPQGGGFLLRVAFP